MKQFFIIAVMLLSQQALGFPRSVNCIRKPAPAHSTILCRSESKSLPVSISYKTVPGWNSHAALRFIEICELEPTEEPNDKIEIITKENSTAANTTSEPENNSTVDKDDDKEPKPTMIKKSCIRRFCSRDMSSTNIVISGAPVPIGFVLIKLWLGRKHDEVEIKCKNTPTNS